MASFCHTHGEHLKSGTRASWILGFKPFEPLPYKGKGLKNCKPIYIYTYTHTYIHTYVRTYVRTYIRTYIHTYIHTCIHTYIHACICVHIRQERICINRCTYTYIYIYICICMYVRRMCMCMYTYSCTRVCGIFWFQANNPLLALPCPTTG